MRKLKSPSFIATLAVAILIIYSQFNIGAWQKHHVIQADVSIYYSYLPAIFIYNDLEFSYKDEITKVYGPVLWSELTEDGKKVQKCTNGLAIMNTPLFLIANWLAEPTGFARDGYSVPYQMAVSLSGALYVIIGLFFLRRLLLRFFNEKATMLAILSIVLTTNLYFYSTTESAMSHAYSFGLFAIFLVCSLNWLDNPSIKNSALTGIIAGFIVLVRPTNGLIFIVPFLYGVTNLITLKSKLVFLLRNFKMALLASLFALLVVLPQLIYWKYATGNWLYYSYAGESFFFTHPNIINGLFSFRKGWLVYTPVVIFAFAGIIYLRKKLPALFLPVLLFTLLNVYVVFSWWSWWYGGGFGARAMVESYSLLAMPLAVFYQEIFTWKKWKMAGMFVLCFGFTVLNLFQTLQKRLGIIHFDSMSKELYWKVFGKLDYPTNYWKYLNPPDYDKAKLGKSEVLNYNVLHVNEYQTLDFNDSDSIGYREVSYSPPYSLKLDKDHLYSPSVVIPSSYFKAYGKKKLLIRAKAQFYQLDPKSKLNFIVQFHENYQSPFSWRYVSVMARYGPQWNEVQATLRVPDNLRKQDFASIFLFSQNSREILIDDLKVEILEIEIY